MGQIDIMTNTEPLLLILMVFTLLWLIGWQLNKLKSHPNVRDNNPVGLEVSPYIHVLGLNESQCNELKAILEHADHATLTKFIAYYRPRFIELDQYISTLRKKYLETLAKPVDRATEIEKIAAVTRVATDNPPQPFDFGLLTKSELRVLYEYNPENSPCLNKDLVQKLGDIDFIENFKAYKQLVTSETGTTTVFVAKNDSRRVVLELLANNGLIRRGRKIELKDRLRVLSLDQLNKMAKELKIAKIFQTHESAVQSLAQVPGSAILLAMIYSIDDLFFLDPTAMDIQSIQQELNLWSCYGKLIAATSIPTQKMPRTQSL